ncbi:two-component system sensor histidine kinase NtrB [Alteromonas flava]|uniref:two-component system sensor histidine kinase NtrB n=1 Tax=Alteromonas flava TaxID=2048003 RepID=UPI000C2816CE|nr:ATP-binding protein [Alteromonas flava]
MSSIKAIAPSNSDFLGKMLADSASVLIWIANTDKECIYFNQAWLAFRGRSLEQEMGYGWAKGVHPEDYERCISIYSQAFEQREPFNMDYRLLAADGNYYWIRDEGRPYFDEDNVFQGYIGSCFEVSDLKDAQSKILQKHKMEALGKLAGGLAHDFNNKLAGIMGYAQLISTLSSEEKAKKLADNIVRICENTGQTTKTLLEFAKKREIVTFKFDVHRVVNAAVQLLQHTLDKKIEIKVSLEATSSHVRGDEAAIENVLLNLCFNAKEAILDSGTITVSTTNVEIDNTQRDNRYPDLAKGQYLLITVADTGIGISTEDMLKIFDPFFTTKTDGTGMGLSSSFATIQQHEGHISAEPNTPEGSTFKVLLPIAAS